VQAHELPMASGLLDCLPDVPGWMVGDSDFASDVVPKRIRDMDACLPSRRGERMRRLPAAPRSTTTATSSENLWARLKEWYAVATGYEKAAPSFLSILSLAAEADWIKLKQAIHQAIRINLRGQDQA
jgi:hypothetical protein